MKGRAGVTGTLDPLPGNPLPAEFQVFHEDFLATRPPGADEDVHMLPAVVDRVIERCTAPGDLVFDPFAGFGTTLERAVSLGRRALGIELLPERVADMRRRIPGATIIEGDARELLRPSATSHALPQGRIDLILTSPPYMTETHHAANPLTAYEEDTGDYPGYLRELSLIVEQCALLLKRGGHLVWNVADIEHMGHTTHLIADCAEALEQHLSPVGITSIVWDALPHDLVADALLVFKRQQ